MNASIVAALIASSVSLVIAASTAVLSIFQNVRSIRAEHELAEFKNELERSARSEERGEERRFEAKAQLDLHREPLLIAAYHLGDRIDNIRNGGYLGYLGDSGHRGETVLRSTLFRFGQFFARVELLYASIALMRFESDESTRGVAARLADIGRAFAWDNLVQKFASPPATSKVDPLFMLWREEQRAIGEMMCEHPAPETTTCVGYASFANDYADHFSKWFMTFADDLKKADAAKSNRLALLQGLLASLVMKLDEERAWTQPATEGHPAKPDWIANAPDPSDFKRLYERKLIPLELRQSNMATFSQDSA